MDAIIKTRDEWRNIVTKQFLLASLMKGHFWSCKLIPWRVKGTSTTTHFKVSLCKYTGSTRSGFESSPLMLLKDGDAHLFMIPAKYASLHYLANKSGWSFDSFGYYSFDANLAHYCIAKAFVFDELFKNINDLYWNWSHVMSIENPEQWMIEHELNMPDATINYIEHLIDRIEKAEKAKMKPCYK